MSKSSSIVYFGVNFTSLNKDERQTRKYCFNFIKYNDYIQLDYQI